ncbi:PREDICTED: uncharacterized protein C9orf131 homolog [Chrysochloris asiatica]|uniref:Uncharacterized protein C9orf131 homolog n=1 Tax=Chrysochloris asiatica TaxID=185453 RepID=A0A9B0TM11_CHRAS|nr:PREDICTED: uncharacterized protein C9orf131 homolog [Chrysochloris asiatica]
MPGSLFLYSQGLPLLYRVSFLDCLWKEMSEEQEDEGTEEEEEEEDTSLDPLKVSSNGVQFDSKAICGDMQRRKDSWVSELPGCSLPQDLHGANAQEILSDSRLVREVMEQKNCAPVPPARSPSLPPNSVSKSHIIEPIGDQWDYRPEGEVVVEQTKNCCTTELLASAPSSLFAPTPEVPLDSEFGWGYRQQSEVPQGFSPLALDLWQPILGPSALAETLKIPRIQPDLIKEELFPGAKEETPPSQEEVVPIIPTHPGVPGWQWSRELELRLKKLQQNASSRSPGLRQPPCSFPATRSITPGSWECSSCSPQQAPNVCPCSSSCRFQEFQGIVPQPDQGSYCHHPHPSSQSQSPGSSRAKRRSQEEERVKKKVVVQVFLEASDRHPGLGESSNSKVPVSGKKQNKVSTLPSTRKKEYPKTPRPGGNAVVTSSTVTGNHRFAQAPRLVEPLGNRLSPTSQSKNQSSLHTALPRLLPKTEGHQNQWGAGMGAGDMPDPQHCKHCKRYLSSTPQALPARCLQRVLAKFLGTLGPQSTKANQQR